MKYQRSSDGKDRVSVQVIVRLDPEEVEGIKEYLKRKGQPFNDEEVREFVRSCTEYLPPELDE